MVAQGQKLGAQCLYRFGQQQPVTRLGDHDRVKHDGRIKTAQRTRHGRDRFGISQHADLDGIDADIFADRGDLCRDGKSGRMNSTPVTPIVFCAVSAVNAAMA